MRFVELLRPELIRVTPAWHGFDDTIAGLTGAMVAAGDLPPNLEPGAVRAVTAREADASTALLDIHVGVPHARPDGMPGTRVALAASAAGLYEPVPTVPIQIVALVLSPPDAREEHLGILASIATLLRSAALRGALVRAPTADTALAALRRHARAMPG